MVKNSLSIICLVVLLSGCTRRDSTSSTTSQSNATRPDTVVQHDTVTLHDTSDHASASNSDVSGWQTYRNDRYHFEFQYPPNLKLSEKFSTVDILPGTWRAMATPDEPGHQVISVQIVHMTGRTSYPRFYDVEFRVGVSDSLANCKAGNGERTIGPIVINGSTFNQFEFSDAAMMKYITGISYRTGHDGRCYAIEQIKAGSSYHDQSSKNDIDKKTLDDYYYLAGKIVKTFRFWMDDERAIRSTMDRPAEARDHYWAR